MLGRQKTRQTHRKVGRQRGIIKVDRETERKPDREKTSHIESKGNHHRDKIETHRQNRNTETN
jgi:hypothetical protein